MLIFFLSLSLPRWLPLIHEHRLLSLVHDLGLSLLEPNFFLHAFVGPYTPLLRLSHQLLLLLLLILEIVGAGRGIRQVI